MLNRTQGPPFVDGLYGKFVEYGIKYFFPTARLEAVTTSAHTGKQQIRENPDGSSLTLNWMGTQYVLDNGKPFSDSELKLLRSIGTARIPLSDDSRSGFSRPAIRAFSGSA